MQTFLPYPDIIKSVKCLDNKRLGKQRVEALQILKANSQGSKITFNMIQTEKGIKKQLLWFKPLDSGDGIINTPWYNHPCTKMWKGFNTLLEYYMTICIVVWSSRGFKNNMIAVSNSYFLYMPERIKKPFWFGNKDFHNSHKSNLLRKDSEFYSQYNWDVPNDLPYIWPV